MWLLLLLVLVLLTCCPSLLGSSRFYPEVGWKHVPLKPLYRNQTLRRHVASDRENLSSSTHMFDSETDV